MSTMQEVLIRRSSVRHYDATQSIPEKDKECILQAIQQSPTYIGGQQYSVIVIEDQEQKNQMAQFSLGSSGKEQAHIKECSLFLLFVVDFNKIHHISQYEGLDLEITNYMEGLLIGSVDIGIGVEAATVCAESLGYGTVIIGALRRSVKEIIEAYNLPKYTFPLLGLCIGHAKEKSQPRPRLAMNTFAHKDKYALDNMNDAIEQQNKAIAEYYKEDSDKGSWSQFIAQFYQRGYRKELLSIYKEQGFDVK